MNSDDTEEAAVPADLTTLSYAELLQLGRCCTGLLPDDRYSGGMMVLGLHTVGGRHKAKDCTNPVEAELHRRAEASVKAAEAKHGRAVLRTGWVA